MIKTERCDLQSSDLPFFPPLSKSPDLYQYYGILSIISEMPTSTQTSALGRAGTVLSMFRPGGTNLLGNKRLQPNHLDRARNIILDGYNAVSRHMARAAQRTATPAEPVSHELQTVHEPPVTHTREELGGTQEQSAHALEGEDLEAAVQPATVGDNSPIEAPPTRFNHAQIWVPLLIVGVLCLIVVPGLVLGIVTAQPPWGIALSGAIATVVSFLAGLYYHLSNRHQ